MASLVFLSALLLSAVFLTMAFLQARRTSISLSVFCLMTLLLCSLIPVVHGVVNGLEIRFSQLLMGPIENQEYFISYAMQVLLLSVCIWGLAVILGRKDLIADTRVRIERGAVDIEWLRRLSFWTVLGGLVLYLVGTGAYVSLAQGKFLDLLIRSRMDIYESGSLLQINIAFYLLSFIAVFAFCSAFSTRKAVLEITVVVLVVLFMTVFSGGRKWIILLASGYISAYILRHGFTKKMLTVGGAGVALLVALQFFRSTVFRSGEWDSADVSRIMLSGDIVYFYFASVEAIRHFAERDLFIPFATIRTFMFLPVPVELSYGMKVPDLAHIFGAAFVEGSSFRANNNPPGLIGLGFINLGHLGFLVIAALMAMFVIIERFRMHIVFLAVFYANLTYIFSRLIRGSIGGVYVIVFEIAVIALAYSAIAFLLHRRVRANAL